MTERKCGASENFNFISPASDDSECIQISLPNGYLLVYACKIEDKPSTLASVLNT